MNTRFHKQTGSALVVVMILSVGLAMVLAGALRMSLSENKLNHSNRLTNEARLAAETALEFGLAQLTRSFNQSASLFENAFNPFEDYTSPLKLTPEFFNFYDNQFKDSRLVLPDTFDPKLAFEYDTTLVAGLISEQRSWQIDPNVPGEESNPLAGTTVRVQTVDLYAKATTSDERWGSRTAYLKQTFRIIDQSLYQYVTFYASGDLELGPGEDFNAGKLGIPGPIHSNHNIYLGTTAKLNINVRMTSAGNFYAKRNPKAGFTSEQTLSANKIALLNASSNMLKDLWIDGSYLDSSVTNFRQKAAENFRGGVLTKEHGVQKRYPVGIEELSRLFEAANSTQTNWEYHVITPPANVKAIKDDTLLSAEQKHVLETVEDIKFSTRSGLTIELNNGNVELYTYEFEGDPFSNNPRIKYDEVTGEPIKIPLKFDGTTAERFWQVQEFKSSADGTSGNVTSGLYDFRMAEGGVNTDSGKIHLLRLDVGKFRAALETHSNKWKRVDNDDVKVPSQWWNGGVYVKMPPDPAAPVRADRIVRSNPRWAVQLHNATTLPNPEHTRDRKIYGMTLATNSGLYVQGTYNAPSGKGTNTNPENEETFGKTSGVEVPAALIADSITLLSNNWNNTNSRKVLNSRVANNTVVSAAFITGNVPSASVGTSNHYSGGVENFPRFLEKWSGKTLTYRGSMIMLYRSMVQDKKWVFGGNYYDAPKRDWGFNQMFSKGWRPPLDIGPRSYQRTGFVELTKEEFDAEISALKAAYLGSEG